MADNNSLEIDAVHSERQDGGTKPATSATEHTSNFLHLPGVTGNAGCGHDNEADIEKGQSVTAPADAVEEQRNQHDVSPLTVPAASSEPTSADNAAGAATTPNKKRLLVASKLRLVAKNKIYLIGAVLIVALLAATITLSIVVSKDNQKTQYLESSSEVVAFRSSGDYLEGFSGIFEHPAQNLVKHDVDIDSASSATCDDRTTYFTTADTITTFVDATLVVNKTMTVTTFTNATLLSVPTDTTMSMSVHPMVTTIHTCLEWGDGAGPCTRPYGSPNSTPESVLSILSAAAMSGEKTTSSSSTDMVASMAPMAPMDTPSIFTVETSLDHALSVCEPTVTTTVFVTLDPTATDGTTTMTMVDTQTAQVTFTIQESSSITTMAESVSLSTWGVNNGTTAMVNDTLTTLSVPTWTITLQSTIGHNGTVTTGTASSHTTGNSNGGGPMTSTAAITSGGGKTVNKPLCTTDSGGRTGNGLYCVVMLVGIITALLL